MLDLMWSMAARSLRSGSYARAARTREVAIQQRAAAVGVAPAIYYDGEDHAEEGGKEGRRNASAAAHHQSVSTFTEAMRSSAWDNTTRCDSAAGRARR